mgnify:CR=1 FL=1
MPRGKRWESFPKEATFPRRLGLVVGLAVGVPVGVSVGLAWLDLSLAWLGLTRLGTDTGTWLYFSRELEDPW